jgi:hypothetical protein
MGIITACRAFWELLLQISLFREEQACQFQIKNGSIETVLHTNVTLVLKVTAVALQLSIASRLKQTKL